MDLSFNSIPTKRLALTIDSTASIIKVNNILDWNGDEIASVDLGAKFYAVFRNALNTQLEIMELDPSTIGDNSTSGIVIIRRGLKFNGDLLTEVSGYKKTWVKDQTIVELGTDVPQIFRNYVGVEGDQAVNGLKTFGTLPQSADVPSDPEDLTTKSYVDSLVIAGAPDATNTSKGIGKLSQAPGYVLATPTITIASPAVITSSGHGLIAGDTFKLTTTGALPTGITAGTTYYVIATGLTSNTFQFSATSGGTAINTSGSQSGVHKLTMLTPFFVGINDYRLNPNNSAADGGGTDAYAITLAQSAPPAYITGQVFHFKANTANTGPCTLNVNGLGALAVKRSDGTTDTLTGDILANQRVMVQYNGTNFTMLSAPANTVNLVAGAYPAGNASLLTGLGKFGGTGADGALSIGDTLRTGTVTTVGTAVVGVGTTFLSQMNVGDVLVTGTGYAIVSAIADDTHMTLAGSLSGGDVSGVAYSQGLLMTISAGAAKVFVKNYTSMSITGHARLVFTTPHANGTNIFLKSQAVGTFTSVMTPMIDCSGMGGAGGASVSDSSNPFTTNLNGLAGQDGLGFVFKTKGGSGGINSAPPGGVVSVLNPTVPTWISKYNFIAPGAGGGSGQAGGQAVNSTTGISGAGGRGGGCLVLEIAGALNFTTTDGISVTGTNGGNGTLTGGVAGLAGGGGGGAGGWCLIVYGTLTSASGTVTVTPGTGGASASHMIGSGSGGGGGGSYDTAGSPGLFNSVTSTKDGGDGALGCFLIIANTEFV